jgi:uncharacterized protein (TIGR02145 family)
MKKLLLLSAFLIFACSYGQGEQLYADGTATDQDGNTFEWINYSTQDWAIENAEVVTYRDGTPIPQVTNPAEWQNLTTGAWCYYNNDPSKGKLYNWYAVAGIHDNEDTTPNKEFAQGWHVPSDAEWTTLEEHLVANSYNYDGSSTGYKTAKSMASTTGWNSSTFLGAVGNEQSLNNSSGFNAFPDGYFGHGDDGSFNNDGYVAIFWSSTENLTTPYARYLDRNNNYLYRNYSTKVDGFSVRFVRDASSVGAAGILLNGTISAENNQIKNVADPTDAQDAVTLAYINQLESSIDNLQDQIDELRNLQNWEDNDQDGFSALSGDCDDTNASINPNIYEVADGIDNNCDGFVDEGYEALDYPEDIDGNTYDFAIYGGQHWTVENAEMVTYRDGTPIPQITDDTEWADLTTGAWCYYENDETKGKLYNWYAVMGIHDAIENTPNKEFAPEGWHVPTDAEWTTLEEYLIANGYNYDGTTTGNKIAKAMASTTGWDISTIEGTVGYDQSLNNSSGFNAYPERFRNDEGEFDLGVGNVSAFWSLTDTDNDEKLVHFLSNQNDDIIRENLTPLFGISVRFVRD